MNALEYPHNVYLAYDDPEICLVFNNPMLLEMILKLVVWTNGNSTSHATLSTEDLKRCRLVCKQWNSSIAKIFSIKHIPMLFLNVGLNASDKVIENRESPNKLISAKDLLTGTFHCPMLQLSISLPELTLADSYCVTSILSDFGEKICELKLSLPESFSEQLYIKRESFPNLRTCSLVIVPCMATAPKAPNTLFLGTDATSSIESYDSNQLNEEEKLKEKAGSTNANSWIQTASAFLNLVIASAANLQLLEIRCNQMQNYKFEYEQLHMLPRTLKVLRLIAPVCSFKGLQTIIDNNLFCLEELSIVLNAAKSEEVASAMMTMLHDVFNNVAQTLRILSLECVQRKNSDDIQHNFRVEFPIFPRLILFTLKSSWSKGWSCSFGKISDRFPKIEKFTLIPGDESLLVDVTESSCPKLNQFNLVGSHLLTVDSVLAKRLTLSFTNLCSLELCTWGPDKSGLRLIFMKLGTLEYLKILIGSSPGSNAMDLDSLFTGIPSGQCKSLLLQDRELWQSYFVNDFMFHLSIRQLTRLKSISIFSSPFPSKQAGAFMSELSFHFAFFKMNPLLHLTVGGDLKVSPSILEQWMELKKTSIICNEISAKCFLNPQF